MEKMTKNNFTSPEGDFETRIALVIVLSLIIFVIVIWNVRSKEKYGVGGGINLSVSRKGERKQGE